MIRCRITRTARETVMLEALERVRDRGTMEEEDTRIATEAIATVKAMDEAEFAGDAG